MDKATRDAAGNKLAQWAIFQARMLEVATRPYAIINGSPVPPERVVYHAPGAVRR